MTQKIGLYTENAGSVWFGVACDEEKVYATSFASNEKSALKSLLDCIPFDTEFQVFPSPSAFAKKAFKSAESVYNGKGELEPVPLAIEHLSPFSRGVLEITRLIPVGYVTSYSALSKATGGSPRAVGGVMATNPFAPIVPCHRVVRSDFTLGGYGGGLDVKVAMLTREKRDHCSSTEVPVGNKRLLVYPVELTLEKVRTRQ